MCLVFTKCLPSVYPSVEIAKPVSITYYFLAYRLRANLFAQLFSPILMSRLHSKNVIFYTHLILNRQYFSMSLYLEI